MRTRTSLAVATLAAAIPVGHLLAQGAPVVLAGRHQLALSAGFTAASQSGVSVGLTGVSVSGGAAGALGGLGYAYWLDDRLAVGVRVLATGVSADVAVTGSGARVESGVVGALLVGVRYQVARVTASNALRPVLSLAVGPLIGSADRVSAGVPTEVSTVQEAALGGLLAFGGDLSFGRRVVLGVDAGYLFATDFGQRIGSRTNYRGPVFALSFGLLLGGGRAASP
jgi:hypothetical protein